ncbi:MAG: hypothetical protein J6L73_02550 [Muribaculaceae bacterium]|nr:hypothetical protein [Muribaculaceae bacterium]
MKLIHLTLLCAVMTLLASAPLPALARKTAQKADSVPDFAYPETVINNATVKLDKAVKSGDARQVIRQTVDLIIAKSIISGESFNSSVRMLDSLASVSGAAERAILYSLEAEMYAQKYDSDSFQADSRNLPLDSYPENVDEWSKQLYAKKVNSLVKQAMAHPDLLRKEPLSAWRGILKADDWDLTFYPTVYDMIAEKSIKQLEKFVDGNRIPFETVASTPSPAEDCAATSREIIASRLDYAKASGDVAALTVAYPPSLTSLPTPERIDSLLNAYKRYSANPYSLGFLTKAYTLLQQMDTSAPDFQKYKKELYSLCSEGLKKYPDYKNINAIRNLLGKLQEGSVNALCKNSFVTTEHVVIDAQAMNMGDTAYLHLFECIGSPNNISLGKQLKSKKLTRFIKSIPIKSGFLEYDSIRVDFGMLPVGKYAVCGSSSPVDDRSKLLAPESSASFRVSDMAITTIIDKSSALSPRVYVLSALTGAPLPGIDVRVYSVRYSDRLIASSRTNKDGYIEIQTPLEKYSNLKISASNKSDKAELYSYLYGQSDFNGRRANIFTDLSIYHPGDTCRFAVVANNFGKSGFGILPGCRLKATLTNNAGVDCDTLNLVTDDFGRASGEFALPKSGLNGYYRITVESQSDQNGKKLWSSAGIRVEDYKQPTFYVQLDKDGKAYAAGDEVTLKGIVATYSGMPLAGIPVKIKVNYSPSFIWRWYSASEASYAADVKSAADGSFELRLPTGNLRNTSFADGVFTYSATATSDAGESQISEEQRFFLGKISQISFIDDNPVLIKSDTVNIRLSRSGAVDLSAPFSYLLKDSDKNTVLQGTATGNNLALPAASIPSGKYSLTVSLGDCSVTDSFVFYRLSDSRPPVESILWVPETQIYAAPGKKTVQVRAGSSYDGQYILYSVNTTDKVLKYGFLKVSDGIATLDVDAPVRYYDRATVRFFTVHNSVNAVSNVTVLPDSAAHALKMKTLSFRDHINAGGKERWTFSYSFANTPVGVMPVLATMSDKALNALYPFEWSKLGNSNYFSGDMVDFNYMYEGKAYLRYVQPWTRLRTLYASAPWIDTYGQMLAGSSSYFRRGGTVRIRGCSTTALGANQVLMAEDKEADIDMAYAAVPKAMAKMESMEDAAPESAEAGGVDGGAAKEVFRGAECPSAFFMPNLSTDKDGVLELSFDAPNFNTTWQLQLLGYLPDLRNALDIIDVVASKPIMVSANAPRFLRTGDKAVLQATIFNNTGSQTRAGGYIEIFDPLTYKVLVRRDYADETMAPEANRVIEVDFAVPSDLQFVGYRVMGRNGSYSDGEQSLIAIRPSSTPVTESYPFYMSPSANEYSMKLPQVDKNASVTFQYCDNPVWYCVTALPDMSFDKSASILSRADALYGNAIAAGLAGEYPALRQALKAWSEAGDSTMVSNLQKDAKLKIVALENTPWVNDAAAETLRMSRLVNLLDTAANVQAVRAAIEDIAAAQNGNGGWSWCPGMDASAYITGQILWRLGMLKSMGYLPDDSKIGRMVAKGLKYVDSDIVKDYKKYGDISESTMLNWLYIRSFFDSPSTDATFLKLQKTALAGIKKNWKKYDIYDKATAATLLWREKYPMESRSILESLRQSASKSAERGAWFDNLRAGVFTPHNTLITTTQALEAFNEIEPGSPMVDALRQWLIIERQAQDWGNTAQLAEVVYAVLTSGSKWTESFAPAVVTLNGKAVEPSRRDLLTGAFTVQLPAAEASGAELRVVKSGSHQSWGGVMAQYIAPINTVKQFSESDVSVRKRVLVVTEDAAGETVAPASGRLKVGQKVRVELTVTSARDIDYAVIVDGSAGCLAPADQLSHYVWRDGVGYYREVKTDDTNFYMYRLPRGTFLLTYDCFVSREGDYANGIATLQSLYAPMLSAHSAGEEIQVRK